MYSLNWHRSFDVCKLVDARRRASVWMRMWIFNISLIWCVGRRTLTRSLWTGLKTRCTSVVITRDVLITHPARAARLATKSLPQEYFVYFVAWAQKDANDVKTFLKHFSRLVVPHMRTSVAEIKWMVAKTLFILFFLHNIIFDNYSQCAAP